MEEISIEVVFAAAEKQQLVTVTLPNGATVAEAIAQSSIASSFPQHDLRSLSVGVWGHEVTREHVLSDGDRIEIYRPLNMDPREARRQFALAGQTMTGRPKDPRQAGPR